MDWVYMLECGDGSLYTGWTNDLATVFTDLGEHFPQQGGAPFLLVRARGVVIILLLQTVHLFGHDGLIPRQIKPAFLHTPARFL